jgi:hypothetical protein
MRGGHAHGLATKIDAMKFFYSPGMWDAVDFAPYPNILRLRKRVSALPAVQPVMRAEDEPWPFLKS